MPPRSVILCYHAVSDTWPNRTAVSEGLFERQLSFLRKQGYAGVTLSELVARRHSRAARGRAVAVTFDDGYASTARALPILDAIGYPATVFVVTGFVESGAPLSWPGIEQWLDSPFAGELAPLRWEDLRRLAAAGWEVGSHTQTHPLLPPLGDDELEREVAASRSLIAEHLGRCDTLAYPYGAADERVARAVRGAGYQAACVVGLMGPGADELRLGRIGLYGRDDGFRLRAKLSTAGRALAHGLPRPGGAGARRTGARDDGVPDVALPRRGRPA